MNPDRKEAENKEVIQEETQELNIDELDQVSGAGNPFEDVPRVPLQPIDPNLRGNG